MTRRLPPVRSPRSCVLVSSPQLSRLSPGTTLSTLIDRERIHRALTTWHAGVLVIDMNGAVSSAG